MDPIITYSSNPAERPVPHAINILSGGLGASAEQVVHTVLAQFPESRVKVTTIPNLRNADQVREAMQHAKIRQATVIYTLVDHQLRAQTSQMAGELGVFAIDLMGDLIEHLVEVLGAQPLEQPGLYRRLNEAYFGRVAAIEYTIAHDDGQRPETWEDAEIVLVGASRVGKTPLSMYLSVLGWKVANIPLVPLLDLPAELDQLDWKRVIGLTIAPGQLLAFRKERQHRLGVPGPSDYIHPQKLFEELQYVEQVCRQAGFTLLDVTDKPIETSADEIMQLMDRRFGDHRRSG
jgi:hypothetical protein